MIVVPVALTPTLSRRERELTGVVKRSRPTEHRDRFSLPLEEG